MTDVIYIYLKLALRLLIRNPFFAALNVIGLSAGFASFFILWQYSQDELASDRYHQDADRIFRVGIDWKWTDNGSSSNGQMLMAGNSAGKIYRISKEYPEIRSILRINHQRSFIKEIIGHGPLVTLSREIGDGSTKRFKESEALYADPNLFEFFSIPLVHGEPSLVLRERNSIVLSEKTAQKYFGEKNPVGELLVLNGTETLKVTGVFKNLPKNTHLVFDFVISNRAREEVLNNAFWSWSYCYFKLAEGNVEDLEDKINSRMPIYWADVFKTLPHVKATMILQPLTDVPFSEDYVGNNFQAKSKTILIVFRGIAIAILVMAWANYVNLSVSRTSKRVKEIATRKITGAGARDFLMQFVMESCVLNILALLLSMTIIQAIRRPAELFLDIYVPGISALPLLSLLFFLSVILLGAIITGLYPAFLCFSFSANSLFLMSSKRSEKRMLPSLLTTAQYAASIVLIFCGLTIHQQLKFILSRDLGFDQENIVLIEAPVLKGPNYLLDLSWYRNEVLGQSGFQAVTFRSSFINLSMRTPGKTYINTDGYGVDENYIPLHNIKIIAGRNFRPGDRKDVIVITSFAAERLNFRNPQDAIGRKITAGPQDADWTEMEVVGVTENIKTTTFYSSANSEAETGRGVTFLYGNKAFNEFVPEIIVVKLVPGNISPALEMLEKKFSEIFPGNVFSVSFLDSTIQQSYFSEKRISNQLNVFTILAIGIACLGLLGIISNKAVEKTKEIGIRKALGAGIGNIGHVLLRDTFFHVLISVMIALPVAWYFSHQYLQRFTDQITIKWWYFVLPVAAVIAVLMSCISSVLWKAARTNPVEALKYE